MSLPDGSPPSKPHTKEENANITKHHDTKDAKNEKNNSHMICKDGDRTDKKVHAPLSYQWSPIVVEWAKQHRTQLAAGSSSLMSTMLTYPLDLTKSRMQSYNANFTSTVLEVYHLEGITAFWRGVLPPLLSVTLVRTTSFSLYQYSKYTYDRLITQATGQSPLEIANTDGSLPTLSTISCFGLAGATAGAAITTMSSPFELTKLSEQIAGREAREKASLMNATDGSWATAKRLVRERGFRGLYAGYGLHLLRDTIGTAIYFATYETVKHYLGNGQGKGPTSPTAIAVAGGVCGVVSWVTIYPIDVVKTKYQKELLSAGKNAHLVKRPPIKFFDKASYRGLTVSVMRSCLLNAFFFSSFEYLKKCINRLEEAAE